MGLAILATLLLAAPATAADLKAGTDAFRRGDFSEARLHFEPLAYEGIAAAQANMGLMYFKGYGVTLDRVEGIRWYQLAANQGQAGAQNNLASLYLNGDGVAADPIVGLMWLILAREGGYAGASASIADLESKMPLQEVQLAHELSVLWKRKLNLAASVK
jgi:TPR repeat protein